MNKTWHRRKASIGYKQMLAKLLADNIGRVLDSTHLTDEQADDIGALLALIGTVAQASRNEALSIKLKRAAIEAAK